MNKFIFLSFNILLHLSSFCQLKNSEQRVTSHSAEKNQFNFADLKNLAENGWHLTEFAKNSLPENHYPLFREIIDYQKGRILCFRSLDFNLVTYEGPLLSNKDGNLEATYCIKYQIEYGDTALNEIEQYYFDQLKMDLIKNNFKKTKSRILESQTITLFSSTKENFDIMLVDEKETKYVFIGNKDYIQYLYTEKVDFSGYKPFD